MNAGKYCKTLLIALMIFSATGVSALPQMPHQFYGAVTLDGVAAPDGTVVEAKIGGVIYEDSTTSGGFYGWDPVFQVTADDPDTATVEGGVNGDSVAFYVDGIYATSHIYSSLAVDELDLAVTSIIPQIPHQFYGDVTIDGSAAPWGTFIEARIGGVTYESTWTIDGRYGWEPLFQVPADDPETLAVEGGVDGDIVELYVDNVLVVISVFESGSVTELSLVATTPHDISLYDGWNLIGLPFTPQEPSTVVVLSEIIDYVVSVWAFNGETKTWASYSPGAPSNLVEMIEDRGYWIKVNSDCILTLYP